MPTMAPRRRSSTIVRQATPASATAIRMNGKAARPGTTRSTAPTCRNTRPLSTGARPGRAASPSPSSRRPKAATASTTASTSTGAAQGAPACRARAYHFYYFCRPAAEQARWFIRNVPRERDALPPVLDMEWNHLSPTCKLRPDAGHRAQRDDDLPRHRREAITARSRSSTPRSTSSTTTSCRGFQGYPFWLRSVAGHPHEHYGEPPLHLLAVHRHRRHSRASAGDADINVFNGDAAAWKRWLKRNTT